MPSQSHTSERYLVDIEESACTCPDYEERRGTCKHVHAVLFWIAWGRDVGEDGCVTETITIKRRTYSQPWSQYNASQVHERAYVERLLTALCAGLVQPHAGCRARRAYSMAQRATGAPVGQRIMAGIGAALAVVLAFALRVIKLTVAT